MDARLVRNLPTVNWLPVPLPTAAAPALTVVTLPPPSARGKKVPGAASAVEKETAEGGLALGQRGFDTSCGGAGRGFTHGRAEPQCC